MMAHYTDSIINLADRTSSLVIDLLLSSDIVTTENGDRAVAITKERFLSFRTNSALSPNVNIQDESNQLAKLIIADLMSVGFVQEKNLLHAYELAADEILAQRAFMEG